MSKPADFHDPAVAEAIRQRIEGDERRRFDRDRLRELIESVTQPRGTYNPHVENVEKSR